MKTLKAKFIFWICLLFIFIGTFIFISLSIILPEKITAQILKRDVKIAQYLSREVQEQLLVNNKLALKLLLEDRLENFQDVIYIFIRSHNGNVIASTFKKGFPKGLLDINKALPGRQVSGEDIYSVERFLVNGKKAYDIAIPLLKGELGSLHLGVSLELNKTEIIAFTRINYYVAAVIALGLGMGILIFAFLGFSLSSRIIKLKDFAAKVGSGDFHDRIDINSKDEIGSLAGSFNKMVLDLREKIETIKKLSYLEERSRIAVEFHDGLAQDLADIIKRLELCDRLFKIDAPRALQELETLRENTKDVLDKTRQAIFDFKLPKDADFNLLTNINNYIRNYQKQGDIKVSLDCFGPIENIQPDKSRSVFNIIIEALTNIRRHAQARNIRLQLKADNDNLSVNISDDGMGFDVGREMDDTDKKARLGLISMRERALNLGGSFSISSKPQAGTHISVNIPLKDGR